MDLARAWPFSPSVLHPESRWGPSRLREPGPEGGPGAHVLALQWGRRREVGLHQFRVQRPSLSGPGGDGLQTWSWSRSPSKPQFPQL